jgi:catechol 2,3-dioxygenase
MDTPPIHPGVRIGHVHLKVADLERALAFYRDVLGFELTQRFGPQAAVLSAGGYHHHIVAILYPTRALLADALRRLMRAGIELDGAADHGVSEALYLHDPDHNGIELYWDRPQALWPRDASGNIAMYTRPLDLQSLLREGEPV